MPKVTVGYYTACSYCGLRTDVVWGKPTHLCQVCGKPFCKRCGMPYVCKSCFAQKPPDVQQMLTKKARSIPIRTAIGLSILFGSFIAWVPVYIEVGKYFNITRTNSLLFLAIIAGVFFIICFYGAKLMVTSHSTIIRAVNQAYFGKDSKQLNFTGITKTGGFQQVPSNLQPSLNFAPGAFNAQQSLLDNPPAETIPSNQPEFQFCPLCGGQKKVNICQNCGSKICPKCGHPDPDKTAKFCGSCGNVF